MNIYPGRNITISTTRSPYYRKAKNPLMPWYWILLFGIIFGYLLGLVHQAAQHHHKATCEACRTCIGETAE